MDWNTPRAKQRSRDGCWTCRSRKKKCSGVNFPCQHCTRLGLTCDFQPRLVWENDPRRPGIQSRGPKKGTKRRNIGDSNTEKPVCGRSSIRNGRPPCMSEASPSTGVSAWQVPEVVWHQNPSHFPDLNDMEVFLLDHYIHRFSRTYPAFPGPDNPFLSVFVPLATCSKLVLHSLLALSGIQGLDHSNIETQATTLRVRQRALGDCRRLLARSAAVSPQRPLASMDESDLLYLLAGCMLLLLYEKLTGEGQANWEPHFQFIKEVVTYYQSRFMENSSSGMADTFCFLASLFAYHDLLRAMQLKTTVYSTFYEDREMDSKFYYPRLMARICAADMTVTDADIYAWDGNMAWLPSVPGSLQDCYDCKASEAASDNSVELLLKYEASRVVQTGSRKVDSLSMLSELYRVTASLLHKQTWHAHQFDSGSPGAFLDYNLYDQLLQRSGLAAQGINLIQKLLQGSSFKSALLWPIGIIMRDLIPEQLAERECLISGLDYLSKHFHMKHFDCLRTSLELSWTRPTHDRGKSDTLLLG